MSSLIKFTKMFLSTVFSNIYISPKDYIDIIYTLRIDDNGIIAFDQTIPLPIVSSRSFTSFNTFFVLIKSIDPTLLRKFIMLIQHNTEFKNLGINIAYSSNGGTFDIESYTTHTVPDYPTFIIKPLSPYDYDSSIIIKQIIGNSYVIRELHMDQHNFVVPMCDAYGRGDKCQLLEHRIECIRHEFTNYWRGVHYNSYPSSNSNSYDNYKNNIAQSADPNATAMMYFINVIHGKNHYILPSLMEYILIKDEEEIRFVEYL